MPQESIQRTIWESIQRKSDEKLKKLGIEPPPNPFDPNERDVHQTKDIMGNWRDETPSAVLHEPFFCGEDLT